MTRRDLVALFTLSAIWGASFLFMRISAPVLGPILVAELRVLIAGLALLAYAGLSRQLPPLRLYWRHYLVIGIVNSAIPFALISAAELHLSASLAATLNATTPLFGLLVAAFWQKDPLTLGKLFGLLLGLAGVSVLVGLGPLEITPDVSWGITASLLAAVAYGIGAVYTRVKVPDAPPLGLALYSQLFAAAFLLPAVPLAWPTAAPTLTVSLSVLALALLCSGVAYLLYFGLIQRVGAARAMTVTYLSPAFGLMWGAVFLHERLTLFSFAGFGLILLSVALVTGVLKRSRVNRPLLE